MSVSATSRARPRRRPALLVTVCAVVVLEAALLIGVAGAYLVAIARGASEAPGTAAGIAGFGAVVAAALLGCARALWRGRRWARGPVLTWQVLQGATAVSALSGEQRPTALALVAVAVLGAVLLLLPSVRGATAGSGSAVDL
jgi:hypothetical protein